MKRFFKREIYTFDCLQKKKKSVRFPSIKYKYKSSPFYKCVCTH